MLRCSNWSPLFERFLKRLSSWKANSLSFGGRLTLTKYVLGSLGVYYFSTFKAPKAITNKLESIRKIFVWGGSSDLKKIAWIAWDKVIAPLDQGGLNIGSLRVHDQCMLAKWWWRFLTEGDSLWCNVIKSIHGPQGGLHNASSIKSKSGPWFQIAKLNGDLNDIGIDLHSIFKRKVGNGESTFFWTDKWVGNSPLCYTFPRLYRLETNQQCKVSDRVPTPTNIVNHLDTGSGGPCSVVTAGFGPIQPPGLQFQWA